MCQYSDENTESLDIECMQCMDTGEYFNGEKMKTCKCGRKTKSKKKDMKIDNTD